MQNATRTRGTILLLITLLIIGCSRQNDIETNILSITMPTEYSGTSTSTTIPSITRTPSNSPTLSRTPSTIPTPRALTAWEHIDAYYQCINNSQSEKLLGNCYRMISENIRLFYGSYEQFLLAEQNYHYQYKIYDCGSRAKIVYYVGIKYRKFLKTDKLFSGLPYIDTSYYMYFISDYENEWHIDIREVWRPIIESICRTIYNPDRWFLSP